MDRQNLGRITMKQMREALVRSETADNKDEVGVYNSDEADIDDEVKRVFDLVDSNKTGFIQYSQLLNTAMFVPGGQQHLFNTMHHAHSFFPMLGCSSLHVSAMVTPPSRILTAGTLAGFLSRTMTAPLDRVAMAARAGPASVHARDSARLRDILASMVRSGGVQSLWRGNVVNCVQVKYLHVCEIKSNNTVQCFVLPAAVVSSSTCLFFILFI
jgi:hypothetical protein